MVNPEAKQIIEESFKQACSLLGFPPLPFTFLYERVGQDHFFNTEIGAEIDSAKWTVYINEDWANLAYNMDPCDLSFIIAHEVRHFYQNTQINLFHLGRKHKEDNALIISWMDNCQHYQRNEGGETKRIYHRQSLEVDADAFACFYVMYYGIGQPRMSDDSEDLVTQRLIEIAKQYNMTINTAE